MIEINKEFYIAKDGEFAVGTPESRIIVGETEEDVKNELDAWNKGCDEIVLVKLVLVNEKY